MGTRIGLGIFLIHALAGCSTHPTSAARDLSSLPPPPAITVVGASVRSGVALISWRAETAAGERFGVQRRHDTDPWKERATLTADDRGFLRLEDPAVLPGERYVYRIGLANRPPETYAAEVEVLVPGP